MISIIQSRIKSVKNTNIHTCTVANQCSNVRSETTNLNRQATKEPIRGNSRSPSAITKRTAILRQLLKLALRAKEIDIYIQHLPNATPSMPKFHRHMPNSISIEYELHFLRYRMYGSVEK